MAEEKLEQLEFGFIEEQKKQNERKFGRNIYDLIIPLYMMGAGVLTAICATKYSENIRIEHIFAGGVIGYAAGWGLRLAARKVNKFNLEENTNK